MLALKDFNKNPRHFLAEQLPWSSLVAPEVLLQKDSVFQSSFRVCPGNLTSSSREEIDSVVASLNNLVSRFGKGWSLFFETRRVMEELTFQTKWSSSFAQKIEEERQEHYKKFPLYRMEYFLTFCCQYQNKENVVQRFFNTRQFSLEESLNEFQKSIQEVQGLLKESFLEAELLEGSSLLAYLHSCVSNTEHEVLVPPCSIDLDEYLPDEVLRVENDFTIGEYHCSVLSINDFPHHTYANMLSDLQASSVDYRWQQRIIFLHEEETLAQIKRVRRKHYAQRKGMMKVLQEQQTGEASLENTESMARAMNAEEALQLLGEGKVCFALLTSVLVLKDLCRETLAKKVDAIKTIFQKFGFIIREEGLNVMEAWLSSLPGHVYANTRKYLLHSVNLSHLLPISSCWTGQKVNTWMDKISGNSSAHLVANSKNNVFYLNLNVQDVGHCVVLGPTGAGKSTLLAMLAVQFLRYPLAQVIIFDKDFSSLALSKNAGAEIYIPGQFGSTFLFQPFRNLSSKEEQHWALRFCEQVLYVNDCSTGEEEIEDMQRALELLSELELSQRTMSSFTKLLQFDTTKKQFQKYCKEGIYGSVFDGVGAEDEHRSPWMMIEMSFLMGMGEKALIPALLYLFHTVERRFTGEPTLLIIDEGWLFLRNEFFAERFRMWLKTLRKKHVFVVLATQELSDVINSSLVDTIMSACQSRIFLPDKSASTSQMFHLYKKFGLEESEIELISTAIAKQEYYICSGNNRALFSLDLNKTILALLEEKGVQKA